MKGRRGWVPRGADRLPSAGGTAATGTGRRGVAEAWAEN